MISKEFEISTREAQKRLSSTLQHKLRVVLKCYTITNFQLNENDSTFSFNKTNRVRGITINDGKDYFGRYELEETPNSLEDREYKLLVVVD